MPGGQRQALPAVRPVLVEAAGDAAPAQGRPPDFRALFEALPEKYLVIDRRLRHRRGQRCLSDCDPHRTCRDGGPPALRRLPGQSGRSGHRGDEEPPGIAHPRPAPTDPGHHVGAEVRHSAPRRRRRRLRRTLLVRLQLTRSGARRVGHQHRPRRRGRDRLHPAGAPGLHMGRSGPPGRRRSRGGAACPRGGRSGPGPQGGQRGAHHPVRPAAGARPAEDELLRQRQPRAADSADADPRTGRADPGRPPP